MLETRFAPSPFGKERAAYARVRIFQAVNKPVILSVVEGSVLVLTLDLSLVIPLN
jgi:hypothetical protein